MSLNHLVSPIASTDPVVNNITTNKVEIKTGITVSKSDDPFLCFVWKNKNDDPIMTLDINGLLNIGGLTAESLQILNENGDATLDLTCKQGDQSYITLGSTGGFSAVSQIGLNTTGGLLELAMTQNLPAGTANSDIKINPSTAGAAIVCKNNDRSIELPAGVASSSTTTGTLKVTGGAGVSGAIYTGSGIGLPTSTGLLTTYQTSDTTVTWTGAAEGPLIKNVHYVRVGRQVTCLFEALSGGANGTPFTATTTIPSQFRPQVDELRFAVNAVEGGADSLGMCRVRSSGTVEVYPLFDTTSTFQTDPAGFYPLSLSWIAA